MKKDLKTAALALIKLVECGGRKTTSAKYIGNLFQCSYRTVMRRANAVLKQLFTRKLERQQLCETEQWWRSRMEADERTERSKLFENVDN